MCVTCLLDHDEKTTCEQYQKWRIENDKGELEFQKLYEKGEM